MWSKVLCVFILLFDFREVIANEDPDFLLAQRLPIHRGNRRLYRDLPNGDELHFASVPYNKKLELSSSGKIHCKVAGGISPEIQWFLNMDEPLPEGITSANGTLVVAEASRRHTGQYTCRARSKDGTTIIYSIQLDVVVSPRVLEPTPGQEVHVAAGSDVWLHCRVLGEPEPTIHWDRNLTILTPANGVSLEGDISSNVSRIVLMKNGTLFLRNASEIDSDHYGCTAGSAAGLARNELLLHVHPEGDFLIPSESSGVAGKAVIVSISVAGAYMILVLVLMIYCRHRRNKRRQRSEKIELEVAEGREKLVEDGEEGSKLANGGPAQNGRLLTAHERADSGADNSEVSAVSKVSKRSGQYDHLAVPRSLLTKKVVLGRGEFGEVMLASIDLRQLKKQNREQESSEGETKIRPVLVKALTTKDECQLAEFRRQLDMFSRTRHESIARFIGLCNDAEPHYLLLEYTDWGVLKHFLVATRSDEEKADYAARVGSGGLAAGEFSAVSAAAKPATPLAAYHAVSLAANLAKAVQALSQRRFTHRDIAARNCLVTSKLQLKLSFPALTRGPHSHEYYKLHDQVIPLRWLPPEAVLEGDYSTKSDVYMFAATVWEIYTKAELPFAKLNDNSVIEKIKNGTLEWVTPQAIPEKLSILLNKCWSKSPTERPLFDHICEEMNAVLQEISADTPQQNILNSDKDV